MRGAVQGPLYAIQQEGRPRGLPSCVKGEDHAGKDPVPLL